MTTDTFLEAYEKIAELNRQLLSELERILDALEAAAIEVLPLKGADMLGRAYSGTFGLRPMVDVDLLVHHEDLSKIRSVLQGHGFQAREACGNPTYVSATGVLSLDLFPRIWYVHDMEEVWRRTVTRRSLGRMRPAMHPEDAIIYLVAYQTIHRGQLNLQMVRDVSALLDAEQRYIDWRRVIDRATTYHLRLALYHGLSYAREKGQANVPEHVLDGLRPAGTERGLSRLYRRLVTEEGIQELGHFLLVLWQPGWRNKVRSVRETFFPSPEFLALRYEGRTHWSRLLAQLTRPLYLTRRASVLLFRIGRRLLLPVRG